MYFLWTPCGDFGIFKHGNLCLHLNSIYCEPACLDHFFKTFSVFLLKLLLYFLDICLHKHGD